MQTNPLITFIFPNSLNGNLDYHLGVTYIIAFLKSKGIYTEQFVIKRFIGLVELTELLLERQSRIIGFTCFHSNYHLVKILSQQIKIKRPDILIIAGGPTATFSDKYLLKDISEIDICVRGEGEYTTLELVEYLKNNKDLDTIEGITYRKNGNIIRNQDRPFIKNGDSKFAELDILPSPYLTEILKPEYFLNQNDGIAILTSRGCVYRCVYCNFSIMSKHTIRYHSIDRVIAELKIIDQLRKTGKEFKIGIMDDTFTFNRKRVKELCKRIIEEKIKLDFWAETRGDCLDKKLFKLLLSAGVTELNFGLESSVPKILYAMKKVRRDYNKKKGFIPEKRYIQGIKDGVNFAKKIGIKVGVNTIFGFPGETFKDGLRTLNFVKRLKVDMPIYNHLRVYPGTELFDSILNNKPHLSSFHNQPLLCGFTYSEYDLNRLPILYKGVQIDHINLLKYFTSFFLTNTLMGLDKKVILDYPECIILTGDTLPLEWFKKTLAFKTRIMFGENIHRLMNNKESSVKITVKSFAELMSLVTMKGNLTFVDLRKGIRYTGNNYSFLNLLQLNKILDKTPNNTGVIFGVYDNKDIQKLEKEVNLGEANSISGIHRETSLDYIILDACRWSSNCPASQLKRLIIDDNGNIKCCFKGEVIGNTYTPLGKIQRNIDSLIAKIKLERGCNFCSAKDRCSKCIFLGSITQDKYCSIMKGNTTLNNFIYSLCATKTIEYIENITNKRGIGVKENSGEAGVRNFGGTQDKTKN